MFEMWYVISKNIKIPFTRLPKDSQKLKVPNLFNRKCSNAYEYVLRIFIESPIYLLWIPEVGYFLHGILKNGSL